MRDSQAKKITPISPTITSPNGGEYHPNHLSRYCFEDNTLNPASNRSMKVTLPYEGLRATEINFASTNPKSMVHMKVTVP